MLTSNLKNKIVQVVMNNGQVVIGKCIEYVENQKLILENPQMLAISQNQSGFAPIVLTKNLKEIVPIGINSINFGPIVVDEELSNAYITQFGGLLQPEKPKFII